jgi:hypothetical protein
MHTAPVPAAAAVCTASAAAKASLHWLLEEMLGVSDSSAIHGQGKNQGAWSDLPLFDLK